MKYTEMIDFINNEIKAQHLTLAELTRRTFIKEQTINNYLLGKRIMPGDAMLLLLDAIGKPLILIVTKRTVEEQKVFLS